MSVWSLLGIVIIAGAVGGLVASYMTDKGFYLPRIVEKGDGTKLLLPGFVGNILVGAVAAAVSWLLSGASSVPIATLGNSVLVGMAGSSWLANVVGKNLYHATAVEVAGAEPSAEAAQRIAMASPLEALNVAKETPGPTSDVKA